LQKETKNRRNVDGKGVGEKEIYDPEIKCGADITKIPASDISFPSSESEGIHFTVIYRA
jgi:hypothetical protein